VPVFRGHTRIHIRRYVRDASGILRPSLDGVSLSPKIWQILKDKLDDFLSCEPGKVTVIEKDLCVSKQWNEEALAVVVSMQKLYQKKDFSFKFVPDRVLLHECEMQKLREFSDKISDCVIESLVRNTFSLIVKKELKNIYCEDRYEDDMGRPEIEIDIIKSLCECMNIFITLRICKLFNCFGCVNNCKDHECLRVNSTEVFKKYLKPAMFSINWLDVAQLFVHKHKNCGHFHTLVLDREFFERLDIMNVLKNIEKLFAKDFLLCYIRALNQ
jgi:hypothetical protein